VTSDEAKSIRRAFADREMVIVCDAALMYGGALSDLN
jgi:hypothetical protein